MSVSLPGLERDDRGRIKVAKSAIKAELTAGGESPTWSSMLSGRITGKYDLSSSPSDGSPGLRSGTRVVRSQGGSVPGLLLAALADSRHHRRRCRDGRSRTRGVLCVGS